jgi:hypothetical protein
VKLVSAARLEGPIESSDHRAEPAAEDRGGSAEAGPPKGAGVGRVFALAACSIAFLVGLAMLLGGLAIVAAHLFARDDDGYYTTSTEPLESRGFAITSDNIDLGDLDWAPEDAFASLRVTAEGSAGRPVFVAIGRTAAVDGYLGGVARSMLADFRNGDARYEEVVGRAPRGRPGAQPFWVASAEGTGEQEVSWDLEPGEWTAVAMNADASRGVAVDASAGAKVDWLIWVGVGLVVLGALLAGGMVFLILYLVRVRRADPGAGSA